MKNCLRQYYLGLVILLLLMVVPSVANAQDEWYTQVKNQLKRQAIALLNLTDNQITAPYLPFFGTLHQDRYQNINYDLVRGTTYLIVAACDNDCSDVDLKLFDPDEDKIAEDVKADDKPVILFTAGRTGRYVVRVIMPKCSREPCRYGVGIYK